MKHKLRKKIVVSVACYNNEDEIVTFANHLSKQLISKDISLVITLNRSTNPKKLSVLQNLPITCMVFTPPKNLGYLHGCLYGINKYSQTAKYDWAMISNTDITFCEKQYFEKLIYRNYDADVWCVGTKIILSSTGENQNPFALARPSVLKMKIRKLFFSNTILYNIYFNLAKTKKKKNAAPEYHGNEVYAVHGSCFMISPELVDVLLKNNDEIFMYDEEILIAELVRENGKKVFYLASEIAKHNENQVTGKIDLSRKQKWFFHSTKYLIGRFWKQNSRGNHH